MSKRRGLGKGLGALIPSQPASIDAGDDSQAQGLRMVAVSAIRPNPRQPRGVIEEEALQELADSIKQHGLIQPLVVQDDGDGHYTLIVGERRWRASRLAGLQEAPVVVKEATAQEMLELALVENIQRADLNPLEEAYAYQQLIKAFGMTQAQVAQRVGKSRSTVANMVRLLGLPATIQQAVTDGRLSGGHARTLLPLSTPEAQATAMSTIVRNSLSVRQTEALVQRMLASAPPKAKKKKHRDPELLSLEADFRQSLGTRVDIQQSANGGRVVIHYYSNEELQAIYETIVKDGH